MSGLADLLELMQGATGRVRSVQASIVERRRPDLLERAFGRFAERVEMARGGYFHVPLGGVALGAARSRGTVDSTPKRPPRALLAEA